MTYEPSQDEVDALHETLKADALAGGYHLNPDPNFTKDLVRGLLVNEARYGYPSCPCRLSAGTREEDRDIICPCDYRDPDLDDFNACYCALYVSQAILDGERGVQAIPERRPPAAERKKQARPSGKSVTSLGELRYPVWRCKVCGYLCAREQPPGVCPVCKAKRDRFEQFL